MGSWTKCSPSTTFKPTFREKNREIPLAFIDANAVNARSEPVADSQQGGQTAASVDSIAGAAISSAADEQDLSETAKSNGGEGSSPDDEAVVFDGVAKPTGDVDVMIVVATQQQIENLLRDMQGRHEDVLAVAFDQPVAGKLNLELKKSDAEKTAEADKAFADVAPGSLARPRRNAVATGNQPVSPQPPINGGNATSPREPGVSSGQLAQSTEAEDSTHASGLRESEGPQPSPAPVENERFSSIARRLHLPEDVRQLLPADVPPGRSEF